MLQPKVINVEALPDYKLRLSYETGEERLFDVLPYIHGSWFGRLKEVAYFKTVRVLTDGVGIEWAEGHDIAPHELYDASEDFLTG